MKALLLSVVAALVPVLCAAQAVRTGTLELRCSINGHALPQRDFAKSGHYKYEEPVPDSALTGSPVVAEFILNKSFRPGEHDQRELGIVVSSVRLSGVA